MTTMTGTATRFATILAELSDPDAVTDSIRHDHSPFLLATLADCYSPDAADSPGAKFLTSVARDVAERFDDPDLSPEEQAGIIGNLREDGAHEIADGAVPIYTHDRWLTFVDLGAYNEDVTELGATADDLTGAAGVALYMIAERLVRALAEELSDALNEDAADENDEPADREPTPEQERAWDAREDDARGHALN
jgi:hypothetical protein